ncbi:hypothetical protein JXA32_06190 [Candidatus Sumerlaeota bacterium]|nr:hypothetical protein [Candidatus Sumerlaeota bacterium]
MKDLFAPRENVKKCLNYSIILCFLLWATASYAQTGIDWRNAGDIDGLKTYTKRNGQSSVVFNGRVWVIGGSHGGPLNDVWSSADMVSWDEEATSASFSKRYSHASVVFDNKIWVIGGFDAVSNKNDVWYSSDGSTWIQATASAAFSGRRNHTCLVYNNKMWIIGGEYGYSYGEEYNDVWSSSNGVDWTQETSNANFAARCMHSSVVFDNKMWVIGGNGSYTDLNDVWFSNDGVNWTRSTEHADFQDRSTHTSVVFDGKMWVIGGKEYTTELNDAWYSEDGINWTQTSGLSDMNVHSEHTSVVFDGKIWVLGGRLDTSSRMCDSWYSSDGETWTTTRIFNQRARHSSVVFDDKIWVIGGHDVDGSSSRNDVWFTQTGSTWTLATVCAPFSKRYWHTSVVYDNKIWVIGGRSYSEETHSFESYNDVWNSTDGVHWTEVTTSATFAPRCAHSSIVYDNKMWIIGGSSGGREVWYSTDGANWTLATGSAVFLDRFAHSSVVYDNKMWVISGHYPSIDADVWYSSDGVTWTGAAEHIAAYWGGLTTVVYQDKMWNLCGAEKDASLSSVYYSTDGDMWTYSGAVPSEAVPGGRSFHTSVVYRNSIWVIDGLDAYSRTLDNTWFTGSGPEAAVSTDVLDFGYQEIMDGPTDPATVTLTNLYPDGWDDLVVTTVTLQNNTSGSFALLSAPTTFSLTLGESRDFVLTFDPETTGTYTAELAFQTNDPTSPTVIVNLVGEGVVPCPPWAPSNPGATAIAHDQITWTWRDNSYNESEFKLYSGIGATAPANLVATTTANMEQWTTTGLLANTQYAFQVAASNALGDSEKCDNFTTWSGALTPVAPVVQQLSPYSLQVSIGHDGNPDYTEYAIRINPPIGDAGKVWIQGDGTSGTDPFWQTASGWGGILGIMVQNLEPETFYSFEALSRNMALVPTLAGPGATRQTSSIAENASSAKGEWIFLK